MIETIVLHSSADRAGVRALSTASSLAIIKGSANDPIRVRRVSHVEVDEDENGLFAGYRADLSPVGGPLQQGFPDHDSAVAFERQWLEKNAMPFPFRGDEGKPKAPNL